MDYPTYLLNKTSPLFQQKDNIRKSIDSFIKNTCVANILNTDIEKIDNATLTVFHKSNMDKQQMTAKQLSAESTSSKKKLDFQTTLKKSFLPHIIDLAEKNDIQLVFIRIKRRRDVDPVAQPQHLKDYMVNLQAYLDSHEIELIDFTDDKRIKLEHFADGDHLDRTKGKPLFTKMAARALMPIIKKHCK
jgi:hypothetical protein